MKIILYMVQKEFLQVFRNKQMLPMIFALPIVQLILLVYATTMEINNVNICVVDKDKSELSRELISNFRASEFFTIVGSTESESIAYKQMDENVIKLIVVIPNNFGKDIVTEHRSSAQFIINSEDGSAAGIIQSYANVILAKYNGNINGDFRISTPEAIKMIDIENAYWYNPEMDYKQYMAPGILVILVTFIGMFLTAMNVVKEKEIGTIEQLNVTPIRKYQFLVGKMLPFLIIGLFELAFGLSIAKLTFDIPILGNLWMLFAITALYMIVVLSAALLISTVTETQQQAMFISWFFVVIFILMSGLFTPVESMPEWAQTIAQFNPIAHFIEIMRRVLLKGSGFMDVSRQVAFLGAYAFVLLSLAVFKFKKAS